MDASEEELEAMMSDEDSFSDEEKFLSDSFMLQVLDEVLAQEEIITALDSDGNGELSKEEIQEFLNNINDDTEELSFDELSGGIKSIYEGSYLNDASQAPTVIPAQIPGQASEAIPQQAPTQAQEPSNQAQIEALAQTQTLVSEPIQQPAQQPQPAQQQATANYTQPTYSTGGGSYSGNAGRTNASYTQTQQPAQTPLENQKLEDLVSTVRPEKQAALDEANEKYAQLLSDEGPLEELKAKMDNAYESYMTGIKEADSELADAIGKKQIEIDNQESLIQQKETDILNQETTISTLETNYDSLVSSKQSMLSNKASLESLNLDDYDNAKQIQIKTDISALEAKISAIEDEIEATKTKIDDAKDKLEDMKTGEPDGLEALKRKLDVLNGNDEGQMGDLKQQVEKLAQDNPEIQKLSEDYETAKTAYQEAKVSLIAEAKEAILTAQEEINELDSIINEKQTQEFNKEHSSKKYTEPELFTDSNLSVQKIERDGMSYLLIGPEDADPNQELPVLVYMHGMGERGNNLDKLMQRDFSPAVFMQDWDLNNFNGYIICPQLPSGNWDSHVEADMRAILQEFGETHNINEERISLSGSSLGAMGGLYFANKMSDVFYKAAVVSPYNPGNISGGMQIPTKAIVGSNDDGNSKNFTYGTLKNLIGEENIITLQGSTHNTAPPNAYSMDLDGDGNSDLIQWLFSDEP